MKLKAYCFYFLFFSLSLSANAEKLFESQCKNIEYISIYDNVLDRLYFSNSDFITSHGFEREDFCIEASSKRKTGIINSKDRYGIIHIDIDDKLSIMNDEVLSSVLAHEIAHIIKGHGTNGFYASDMRSDELELNSKYLKLRLDKIELVKQMSKELDLLFVLLPKNIERDLFIRYKYPEMTQDLPDLDSSLSEKDKSTFRSIIKKYDQSNYKKLRLIYKQLDDGEAKAKSDLMVMYDSRRGRHQLRTYDEREADTIGMELYYALDFGIDNFFTIPAHDQERSFMNRLFGINECSIDDLTNVTIAGSEHPTYCYRMKLARLNYERLDRLRNN